MRIKCEKCGEDITIKVDTQLEQFKVGRIQCEKCQKISSRYISESDVLLYLVLSEFFYLFLSLVTAMVFYIFGMNWFLIPVFILLFLLGYYVQKTFSRTIWEKAPFKQEIANHSFKEDQMRIAKSTNWQFILFFALAITAITGTTYQLFFFLVSIFAILINILKFFLCLRNEKEDAK
ncbi:MAG: hypothetical protein Q4B60_06935 [Erysipelotrichaceae bacterium]|nr:hypothetical protein [Erysipelotrichaceae bacterium]